MPDFTQVATERLVLRPVGDDDLLPLFAITSDARTWEHEPGGRHTTLETTRAWIARAAQRWERDGLSYWMLSLAATGEPVGIGGVQRRADRTWNLFYRLAPEAWGHGYATETCGAALDAARHTDPDVAVTAWILDQNLPSRRVAERIGLIDQGLRVDANDGVIRRVYADRVLAASPAPGS